MFWFIPKPTLCQREEQERLLKEQANQRAEQERLLKEQEQLKYQTLLLQLKAKGIDITALEYTITCTSLGRGFLKTLLLVDSALNRLSEFFKSINFK